MGKWFGSSGVRGDYDTITPEYGYNLGRAVGKTFFLENSVYIGSDIRATGDILKFCFMSGFSSHSGKITDIGRVPTPVVSFLSDINDTLGIMITASHNPPGHNGFKLFWKGGECNESTEAKIEENNLSTTSFADSGESNGLSWHLVGNNTFSSTHNIINQFSEYLTKSVQISNTEIRIALDCANNVPNLVTPLILKKLGFNSVYSINTHLDFTFPGRPSEPTRENLQALIENVKEDERDIGIAHDGDGDRFAIINEKGDLVKATTLINFFIDHLKYSDKKENVIYLTSDCTQDAVKLAEKYGATVKISRIGRNREHINEKNVLFLAEPNKLIFPSFGKWIDGLYPVLRLLEITKGHKLSSVLNEYEKRKIIRVAFKITEEKKKQIKETIQELPTLWSHKISRIDELDGLKVYLKDHSCLLIRLSGTEPKVKFYLESETETKNNSLLIDIKKEFNLTSTGLDC